VIGAERASKLEQKKSDQERKEVKERVRAEDLTVDVGKYGGYWANEKDMDEWINECEDDLEKRKGVEAQLKFRKFVLHCKNELKERYLQVPNESATKRDPSVRSVRSVPFVKDVDDLVGKRVEHLDSGLWGKGLVCSIHEQKVNDKMVCMHGVKYDGTDEITKVYLMSDLRCGAVRVMRVVVNDLLGKGIEQKFRDDETQAESWWRAKVVDVVDERRVSPQFIVEYQEDEDDTEGEWIFQLYDDYVAGDLRLCDQ
jgi:hypothetical protein